jgi:hypothetical protein
MKKLLPYLLVDEYFSAACGEAVQKKKLPTGSLNEKNRQR